MGISSLGVGSGILTQDVLDQLRKADESQRITPITLNLANENDKKDSLAVLDASMTNFRDAINELKTATAFDGRKATVTGSSVEVVASDASDMQDFTLHVNNLATKQIEQSGAFDTSATDGDVISANDGTFKLEVGSQSVKISYTGGTTLSELKKLIQEQAGNLVDATVLKISDTDSRLILSSKETGAAQNIKISDVNGTLDTKLTSNSSFASDDSGPAALQAGLNSNFTFNGQNITRSTNQIDDLVTGYKIKLLKEDVGTAGDADYTESSVSVSQNREEIEKKVDSFVEKYNSIITKLGELTHSSTDSKTRGIFSGESSIKSMKSAIENMVATVSGVGGSMEDYGFLVDKDGKMSIDKTIFNTKLDDNPNNVQAFFSGGDFQVDATTTTITGAFSAFYDIANGYTKTNGRLDQVKENITQNISSLEDRKTSATERLDAKYAIMKKQYTAYNALINKFNSASSVFTQLAKQNKSN